MEKVIEDDNLLEEIVIRLPVETVLGCKLVSKRWCNLISSPSFRRRHHFCHLNLPSSSSMILMIDQWNGSVTSHLNICNGVTVFETSHIESYKFLSIQPFYEKLCQKVDDSKEVEFQVHDVNSGLFLVSLRISHRDWMIEPSLVEVHYLVCNPLTKEYQEVLMCKKHTPCYVAFASSPNPSGSYKVIVISEVPPGGDYPKFRMEVYSSETRTCKHLGYTDYCLDDFDKSIVWDNCLLLVPYPSKNTVCVLDPEKLCVSVSLPLLPIPDENKNKHRIIYFGECGGSLYVIERTRPGGHHRVWEMNGVNGHWTESIQFRLKLHNFRSLYLHREGNHFWLSVLFGIYPGKLSEKLAYYYLDGSTERLMESPDLWKSYSSESKCKFRSYTPTLFPLGG